ncbi:hypothetical protein DPU22_26615, partial [Salmonella enterica subsp. enterica serovar Newport]|nr:hypothetical protein [Salmonella enterica subsp. enterica serovar Newport]EGX5251411.1 hypothetical protein [Salmonella enterica subsp. enterica serovar Newport]
KTQRHIFHHRLTVRIPELNISVAGSTGHIAQNLLMQTAVTKIGMAHTLIHCMSVRMIMLYI